MALAIGFLGKLNTNNGNRVPERCFGVVGQVSDIGLFTRVEKF